MDHTVSHHANNTKDVKSTSFSFESIPRHAHWSLRLILAAVFVYHGVGKFTGLDGFASMMGLPISVAFLVAFAEISGGVGAIAGGLVKGRAGDLITRLSGLAIIPVMLGAITMVHWGQWNFMASDTHPMGGMEFQVSLLLVAIYLILKGNRA